MKKQLPKLKTDKEAEDFLEGDLSNLDFSQFQPVRFEFEKKNEQINMRVSGSLMAAVRARAKARGIPYTRFIRETLERAVAALTGFERDDRRRWPVAPHFQQTCKYGTIYLYGARPMLQTTRDNATLSAGA